MFPGQSVSLPNRVPLQYRPGAWCFKSHFIAPCQHFLLFSFLLNSPFHLSIAPQSLGKLGTHQLYGPYGDTSSSEPAQQAQQPTTTMMQQHADPTHLPLFTDGELQSLFTSIDGEAPFPEARRDSGSHSRAAGMEAVSSLKLQSCPKRGPLRKQCKLPVKLWKAILWKLTYLPSPTQRVWTCAG